MNAAPSTFPPLRSLHRSRGLLLLATILLALIIAPAPQTSALPVLQQGGAWQRVWKGDGFLFDLAAIDAQTLVGVGSEGMILRSTDGGTSWHYQSPVPTADLFDLSLQGLYAWTVGQNGIILFSADGGTTWTQLNSGVSASLNGVAFADGNR
ncbi:MAG: hypothetical protein D6775_08535, partial [Caldilineae bacterium]